MRDDVGQSVFALDDTSWESDSPWNRVLTNHVGPKVAE